MKRYDVLEQAQAIKADMNAAGTMLTDEQATKAMSLYDFWNPNSVKVYDGTGDEPQTRVRGRTSGLLHKCITSHTTQEDWPPEIATSLWAVIDVTHTGTIDDPIPAALNMEFNEGLYYLDPEDGKLYLCNRSTGQPVAYLPHDLVGIYFEMVA